MILIFFFFLKTDFFGVSSFVSSGAASGETDDGFCGRSAEELVFSSSGVASDRIFACAFCSDSGSCVMIADDSAASRDDALVGFVLHSKSRDADFSSRSFFMEVFSSSFSAFATDTVRGSFVAGVSTGLFFCFFCMQKKRVFSRGHTKPMEPLKEVFFSVLHLSVEKIISLF